MSGITPAAQEDQEAPRPVDAVVRAGRIAGEWRGSRCSSLSTSFSARCSRGR